MFNTQIMMKAIFLLFLISCVVALRGEAYTTAVAEGSDPQDCTVQIKSKQQWGGKTANEISYQVRPIKNVIIHHTATNSCSNFIECANLLQNIQSFHMMNLHFADIGYNFLIGNDGIVYEGRGFGATGAHTFHHNKNSVGIAFIGTFMDKLPTPAALDAAKKLIDCGLSSAELNKKYFLYAASQLTNTLSPGLALYNEIQTWPHWTSV